MTPTEKDAMALDQMRVASKHLRIPGTEGLPAGPRTADELDKARAHLASRIAEMEETREVLFGGLDRDRDNITTRNLAVVAINALARERDRATRAEAELAAVREDADRYRFLRDMKCNHFHLTLNADHAVNYMTARQWIEEGPDWYSDNTEEEKEAMASANTIWCLQVYPDTPIGFHVCNRATLDAAIDAARGGE